MIVHQRGREPVRKRKDFPPPKRRDAENSRNSFSALSAISAFSGSWFFFDFPLRLCVSAVNLYRPITGASCTTLRKLRTNASAGASPSVCAKTFHRRDAETQRIQETVSLRSPPSLRLGGKSLSTDYGRELHNLAKTSHKRKIT